MNKLLIVLLAVCLVSVHGFVKRDAPQGGTSSLDDITNNIKKGTEEFVKNINEKMNPDNIKKEFNELVDNVNKVIENLKKPSGEAPK